MSVKEDIVTECGDDDEWGDLITTPNRLIPDEFFVLKAEEMDDLQVDDEMSRMVSIAERRGVISGSDCVNGSRIRVSVSSSPATAWSQLLASPSVFSLDSLPDSPIMLPNSQGSPTTGTFPFPPLNHEILGMNSTVDDSSCDSNSLTYPPHEGSLLWPSVADLQNQTPVTMQPTVPVLSEFPGPLPNGTVTKGSAIDLHSSEEFKALKSTTHTANGTAVQSSHTDNQTSPTRQPKETNLSTMRNSEDGYNWRKYGQKQVKGSEYPRSYYKCTHPNCLVKKKVERSHDGHITEIIYKGAHNHQGQRNTIGSTEANGSYIKIGDSEVWENIQPGCTNNIAICQTQDGMELVSSTSVVTDNSDLVSPNQRKSMGIYGNHELSSTHAIYDINEEDGTHIGTLSPGDEADEDKSDLKRRKKGNFLLETSLVTRAMREPRVVVQIESEIDILDDGYRWRKYGQKVVKGNPNPRSYYKCTTTGCPVRKHVERASDDLKSVLTTYEGKHNHELPAARNSTHSHATMDHGSTTNTPNQPLPKLSNVPKSEPQVQDLPLRYDRKLNNDYITSSSFIGNFDTEPTKYVHFQNPLSFNSVLPDFPISLPMTIPPSANMVPNGFGFNSNGKRGRDAHSFIGGQGRDNNGRYLKPKLEQDDGFYNTFMCPADHVNDASSRYCRALPSFRS